MKREQVQNLNMDQMPVSMGIRRFSLIKRAAGFPIYTISRSKALLGREDIPKRPLLLFLSEVHWREMRMPH